MKTLLVVLFFAGLILISPVLPRSVAAAAFPVTKVEDTADGACDSDCSLREAIIASNTLPGSDTIEVPAGTYVLSVTGRYEDAGATGDLDITDDLTITGAGPDLTIVDGSDLDRIVHVVGAHTLSISAESRCVTETLGLTLSRAIRATGEGASTMPAERSV